MEITNGFLVSIALIAVSVTAIVLTGRIGRRGMGSSVFLVRLAAFAVGAGALLMFLITGLFLISAPRP